MIASVTDVANISAGYKWIAVAAGLGVLALLFGFTALSSGSMNPWKLVEGADGRPSTSKLQWFLWIIVVLWSYVVLWVIRAHSGDYSAISTVPGNLLTVLGFSTGTAAVAKGITSAYTNSNKVMKPSTQVQPAPAPNGGLASPSTSAAPSGILVDDSGVPELAKIQMMGFTMIAIGIFVATVIHQVVSSPPTVDLPNIDSSLLVLMGISQGGYLGKKLVTFGAPTLLQPGSGPTAPGSDVTVNGGNLGPSDPGSQILMNGVPIETTSWGDTSVSFLVPPEPPDHPGQVWPAETKVKLVAVVGGQQSNTVTLTVHPG
jgi:hypothetical protein